MKSRAVARPIGGFGVLCYFSLLSRLGRHYMRCLAPSMPGAGAVHLIRFERLTHASGASA